MSGLCRGRAAGERDELTRQWIDRIAFAPQAGANLQDIKNGYSLSGRGKIDFVTRYPLQ